MHDLFVGREELVSELWDVLKNDSIALTGEIGFGKTCVAKKMSEAPPEGWHVMYRDVSGEQSPIELLSTVYDDVRALLPKEKYEGDWTEILHALFTDIEAQEQRVLLVWDNFPQMIDGIAQECDAQTAMRLLVELIKVRQETSTDKTRMLYVGATTPQLVLEKLRYADHVYRPRNDMYLTRLTALAPEHGTELAKQAMKTEDNAFAQAIAKAGDYVPHYVRCLAQLTHEKNITDVSELTHALITHVDDIAGFSRHAKRIEKDYAFSKDAPTIAACLLKLLSNGEALEKFPAWQKVSAKLQTNDLNLFNTTLETLVKDGILMRASDDATTKYRFQHELLRTWWKRAA